MISAMSYALRKRKIKPAPSKRGKFTVIFAVARTVGWVAQWNEMSNDPSQRIGRPRQLYTGYGPRPYVPLEKRRGKK